MVKESVKEGLRLINNLLDGTVVDKKLFTKFIAGVIAENPTLFHSEEELGNAVSEELECIRFKNSMLSRSVCFTEELWAEVLLLRELIDLSCDTYWLDGGMVKKILAKSFMEKCSKSHESIAVIEKYLFHDSDTKSGPDGKMHDVFQVLDYLSNDYDDLGLLPESVGIVEVECLFRYVLEKSLDAVESVTTLQQNNQLITEEEMLRSRWNEYLKTLPPKEENQQ